MDSANIKRLLDFAIARGPTTLQYLPTNIDWMSELADAYAVVERAGVRVQTVAFHPDNRWDFITSTQNLITKAPRNPDDGDYLVGRLWGAQVWCSESAPRDVVLVISDCLMTEGSDPPCIVGLTPRVPKRAGPYRNTNLTEHGMTEQNLPPVGTRVRALVDIHDEASDRTIPQHAKVGDEGVIEGYFGDDEVPTINWDNGGVYDSPRSDWEPVV